jgi:HK97 family phage major capsid protein
VCVRVLSTIFLSLAAIREKTTKVKKENMNQQQRYINEADEITRGPQNPQTRARLQFLLAGIKTMKTEFSESATSERDEQRELVELRDYLISGKKEVRTGMSVATDASGGFLVPTTMYQSITSALKLADGLFSDDVITVWPESHGNSATFALLDDTATVAVVAGEGTNSAEAELAVIDKMTLGKIPTWRSKKLVTTMELAADSAFPLSDVISSAVAGRFQRGIGAANAATLISSTTSGATSESAGAVDMNDILNLIGSLDPAYLNQPKTFFGMNFATMILLLKLKDSQGRNLWYPRYDSNGRPLLYNIPVVLMPSLPTVATGHTGSIVLGDFSACVRRVVKNSLRLMTYWQADNLAENGLIAYEAFVRTSFGVLTSSNVVSPPIKYMTIS